MGSQENLYGYIHHPNDECRHGEEEWVGARGEKREGGGQWRYIGATIDGTAKASSW